MKRFFAFCITILLLLVAAANLSFAQGQIPTGEQISRAAKATKLDRGSSTTAEKDGMKVTVTPADLSKIKSSKDLEKGQIVAVVDVNGIPELPNGRYNVFLLKSNDRWQSFLESGGKIAGDFKRVELSSTKPDERQSRRQPEIVLAPGWCLEICANGPGKRPCMKLCLQCA